jgi:hypothetical protein
MRRRHSTILDKKSARDTKEKEKVRPTRGALPQDEPALPPRLFLGFIILPDWTWSNWDILPILAMMLILGAIIWDFDD